MSGPEGRCRHWEGVYKTQINSLVSLCLWLVCGKRKKVHPGGRESGPGGQAGSIPPPGRGGGGGWFQEQAVCTTASVCPSVRGADSRGVAQGKFCDSTLSCAGEQQRGGERPVRPPSFRIPLRTVGVWAPRRPHKVRRGRFCPQFSSVLGGWVFSPGDLGGRPALGDLRAVGGAAWRLLLGVPGRAGRRQEPRAPGQLEAADGGLEESLQSGPYRDPDSGLDAPPSPRPQPRPERACPAAAGRPDASA